MTNNTAFANRITAVVSAVLMSVTCVFVAVSPAHAAPASTVVAATVNPR